MSSEYRISDGVVLRRTDGVVLEAYSGGKWRDYPGIVDDWFTNSRPAKKSEIPAENKPE